VVLVEPFVSVVLTEKWLPAVPFIKILCLSYFLYPISVMNGRMLLSQGFSKLYLRAEIIKKAFGFTAFFICLPYGISWICASIGFYVFFSMIVSIIFSQKILSIQWIKQFKIILPTLGLALIAGVAAMGVTYYLPTGDFGKLLLGGIVGVGVYVLGAYLLKFDELKIALNYLKKKRP
jgi:O-antigen/teichoic acid export membrane protein